MAVNTNMSPIPINNPSYHLARSICDFKVLGLYYNNHIKLDIYKNHVCIIVNTATKSCLTDMHYKQFNDLMDKFGESKGLRILAFPCNQFGQEEPCTNEEIAKHAADFGVKFDIYAKVNVNCNDAIPLYKYLKKCLGGNKLGDMIKWNYTKFVINRSGIPVERHGPEIFPSDMESIIEPYFQK